MPNVLTVEALKRVKVPCDAYSNELPAMVAAGLRRLGDLQRASGGWGWFDNDEEDPFMTACAVAGLLEAKRNGVAVDEVFLRRGIGRLREMAQAEKDLNRLAFECYALSRVEPCAELGRLVAAMDALSPYALAAGALALHRASKVSDAKAFVDALGSRAKDGHWVTESWYYRWENVAVETTALAVHALVEIDSKHARIVPAVTWLLAQQAEGRWRSTKDTALVIHAVLAYTLAAGGELDALARSIGRAQGEGKRPELLKRVTLRLNGTAREALIDFNNLIDSRFEVHFPGEALKPGRNTLVVECPDSTAIETECIVRTSASRANAPSRIAVKTTTSRPLESLHVGDEVEVSVLVEPKEALDYVMIASPVPAGCEVIRGSGEGSFARFEGRYEEALFYVRTLKEAATFKYQVRVLFGGEFTVRAPSAAVMYDEAAGGRGETAKAHVK